MKGNKMRRRKLSRRKSKRIFKKGARKHKRNIRRVRRGGTRM